MINLPQCISYNNTSTAYIGETTTYNGRCTVYIGHDIKIQAPHINEKVLYVIFNPHIRQARRSILNSVTSH